MKPTHVLAGLFLLSTPFLYSAAAAARSQSAAEAQEAREAAFAELLTGAKLTGYFTDDTRPTAGLQKDSYVIKSAELLEDDVWRIESLIGETNLTVAVFVKVKWAGDTPVITLDQAEVPGMGKWDARVLFHGGSYAGLWSGSTHAGQMVGKVERAAKPAEKPAGK
jgi:hypothetical protein